MRQDEAETSTEFPPGRVSYLAARGAKVRMLDLAYERFKPKRGEEEYERFCSENSYWLEDFVLFVALKSHFEGRDWSEWPPEIRDRAPDPLRDAGKLLQEKMKKEKFLQYLFFRQWFSLKRYCHERRIQIIGDLPIYVNFDSVDVWTNPEAYKLNEQKRPTFVAGVPPDYFSNTGQLWGNPVYDWDVLKKDGFEWWVRRMGYVLKLFDAVRIDHFRGLVAYWEIPAHEKNAIHGWWVPAPAEDLFNTLADHFGHLPVMAEDLGFITPDVREIKERFRFPGMKVLLFAFGENQPMHPYLPHTYEQQCAVYTGTHDNNTIRGWFEKEATPEEKKRLFRYLGREVSVEEIHWEIIRLAMMSVADTAIFPMQDILGLGEETRMNRPAHSDGNWHWRFLPEQLTPAISEKLLEMTETYGRD